MQLPALPFLPRALGFASANDGPRLDELMRALIDQERHLALSGPDSVPLERLRRRLVERLEQTPGVQLMPMPSGNTQHLVDRINALLADIPLGALVEPNRLPEPLAHVFVVHAGNGMPRAPLALLARLSRDLPGARIRIVLVQEAGTPAEPALSLLGAQVLHWELGGRAPRAAPAKPTGPARPRAATAPSTVPPRAGHPRRERVIVAAGAVASAVLASALAWVLATHPPAQQAMSRASSLSITK